jgi:gas vesicle protein
MADVTASSTFQGAAQGAAAGAMFGPIGVGIGAVVGGLAGLIGGSSAEDRAKRIQGLQLKNERNIIGETLRRFDIETEQLAGETKSRAAAAGVAIDVGSPLAVLAEQANERNRERQMLEQQSLARQRLIREGAQLAETEAQSQLISSGIEHFGSAFSIYKEFNPKKPAFTAATSPAGGI